MAEEADSFPEANARVAACEVNSDYFARLNSNLSKYIDREIVVTFNTSHAEAVPRLLQMAEGHTVVLFLDPDRPTSFDLKKDLIPWCHRPGTTDILGLFFPGPVARMGSAGEQGRSLEILANNIGQAEEWPTDEVTAIETFEKNVANLKPYFGIYILKKLKPSRVAYGIYGLSSHPDGLVLLSDAAARDRSKLLTKTHEGQSSLFETDPLVSPTAKLRNELVQEVKPFVSVNPKCRGHQLLAHLFVTKANRKRLFAQFKESDYREIRDEALKELKRSG